MEHLYLIILSNVILISLVNIYFNRVIYKGQSYFDMQFLFFCFVIAHSVYICLARYFFGNFVFIDIGAPFGLFYGPFFYIGLTVLIKDQADILKKEWKHFVPGFVFLVLYAVVLGFFKENILVLKFYLNTMYTLMGVQMMFYTFFGYLKFNSVVKDKKSITMMSQTIILLLASSLIFLAFVFSDLEEKSSILNGFLVYILMFVGVFVLFRYNLILLVTKFKYYKKSYQGKMFFEFFKEEFEQLDQNPSDESAIAVNQGLLEEEVVKYQKSRITEEEMLGYMKNLNKTFDDKAFLNSDLTLDILSKMTRIPKYHLTQVFNLGLNSNFNKYINGLRVQYAIKLLDDAENSDTIEEIMMQSGFNSRSSFYRAFNVYYDISPADYRKKATS